MRISYSQLTGQINQENSSSALSRITLLGVFASGQERGIKGAITDNMDQNIYNGKPFSVTTENAQSNRMDNLFMPGGAERASVQFRIVWITA